MHGVQALGSTSGFAAEPVKKVVGASWLLPDALKGAMRSVSLSAAPDTASGTTTVWGLNIDGSQVMSSDSKTGLWPGCAVAGASPACCALSAMTPACTDDASNSANATSVQTFRTLFEHAALAAGIGAGHTNFNQDDLDEILWEVEGAVYVAHAMSGTIHQGAFRTPIALGNFAPVTGEPSPVFRFTPTVFGSGVYTPGTIAGTWSYDPTGDPQERSAIDTVYTNTLAPGGTALGHRPSWLRDIYKSPLDARYLTSTVANVDVTVANSPTDGAQQLGAWLQSLVGSMNGLTCAEQDSTDGWIGTGKPGDATSSQWLDGVASLKLGVSHMIPICVPTNGDFGNGAQLSLRFNTRAPSTPTNDVDYTDFRDTIEFLSAKYDNDGQADADYSTNCNEPGNHVRLEYSKAVPLYTTFPGSESDVDQGLDRGPGPQDGDPAPYDHTPRCGYFFDRYFTHDQLPGDFNGTPASDTCSTNRNPKGPDGAGAWGVAQVSADCAVDKTLQKSWWVGHTLRDDTLIYGYRQYTRRVLSPANCPKESRALAYVNAYPPAKTCDAAFQLARGLTLACEASLNTSYLPLTSVAPLVTDPLNVGPLSRWVEGRSAQISAAFGRLHLENVPTTLVKNFNTGTVGGTGVGGDIGAAQTKLADSINTLAAQLLAANGELAKMKTALDSYQSTIQGIQDADVLADLALTEKHLATERDMVDSVAKGIETAAGAFSAEHIGPGSYVTAGAAAADAIADVAFDEETLNLIGKQEDATHADTRTKLRGALNQLSGDLKQAETQISTALLSMRSAATDAIDAGRALKTTQTKAQYQLAIAAGADYVTNAAGEIVDLPVNTVMRRQFSATKQRYELALKNAKYLAYVARLAIEQRLGKRLSSLTAPIGALDAPANWADDVCGLTGVNYAALSGQSLSPTGSGTVIGVEAGVDASSGDAGAGSSGQTPAAGTAADQQVITTFAEQFVGDYVTKLQNLVAYYNIAYPSHDGDDIAVLSLAENFGERCTIQSPNLLFESGALAKALPPTTPGGTLRGWSLFPCSTGGKCLQAQPLAAFSPAIFPPAASASQAGTWLYDTTLSAPPTDGGVADADAGDASTAGDAGGFDGSVGDAVSGGGPDSGPPTVSPKNSSGSTAQLVGLTPGGYVLSWWDQAGPVPGGADAGYAWPATAPSVPYRVSVVDPTGKVVQSVSIVPTYMGPPSTTVGDSGPDSSLPTYSGWSDRQTLTFSVPSGGDGLYTIVVRASDAPDLPGSVVIAEMQLEQGTAPTTYQDVSDSQVAFTNDCSLAPLQSRPSITDRFEHVTDATGSYWQLKQPITIDTSKLGPGSASLGTAPTTGSPGTVGSPFAQDNFNYRDTSISVNLVGTGVHDCTNSPTPGCYADSYVDYTLEHAAARVSIVGWDGLAQSFNYGVADVNHGKALAAERYITVPVSGADSALLFTPATEKVEFRGRPLDGTYRLKIWDSPFLIFDRLQDVQIVVKYKYWSPIQAAPSSGL
ncbi:MAG: hypothetical protein ACHREM_06495 [Polyangiales bacterium]